MRQVTPHFLLRADRQEPERTPAEAGTSSRHHREGHAVAAGAIGPLPAWLDDESETTLPSCSRAAARRGMIIELFGPAAAGKTTLMRALQAAIAARGIPVRGISSALASSGAGRDATWLAGLLRASKVFGAVKGLMPGAPVDPLVGMLVGIFPPRQWNKALRVRRYLRHLCRSWNAAQECEGVVIFDQGFVNVLCSLALFSGYADGHALARGLALIPEPDLLVRVETPREQLEARLAKRLHEQGMFERLFMNDFPAALRQIDLVSLLDVLLAARHRRPMHVSWEDAAGLAGVVETIADAVASARVPDRSVASQRTAGGRQ